MGPVSSRELYDLLVKILLESLTDAETNCRINMALDSHSILTEEPFLAKIRAMGGQSNNTEISCFIAAKNDRTNLTIEVVDKLPYYPYGHYHTINLKGFVNNLYGELSFRLTNTDKPSLSETLLPSEKIIQTIFPLTCEGTILKSTITESRILFSRSSKVIKEINHSEIDSLSFEKEKEYTIVNKVLRYVGVILLIISGTLSFLAFIDLGFLDLLFLLIFFGIISLLIGIIPVYNDYILLKVRGESFEIYSNITLLHQFQSVLESLKTGRSEYTSSIQPEEKLEAEITPLESQSPPMEKTCLYCGANNPSQSVFCDRCGAALD